MYLVQRKEIFLIEISFCKQKSNNKVFGKKTNKRVNQNQLRAKTILSGLRGDIIKFGTQWTFFVHLRTKFLILNS